MEKIMESEVVVVGGGVIGSSVAYYLSKKGVNVTLLEKRGICLGTSGSCDGFCFVQSKKPGLISKLALESFNEFERLCKELPHPIYYKRSGGLVLIENSFEEKIMEEFVKRQREHGIDVKIIDIEKAKEFCPLIADDLVGATYSPLDGQVNPLHLNIAFLEGIKQNGGQVLFKTEVEKIIVENKSIKEIRTINNIRIRTGVVVNAAGVESPVIGEMVGVKIPVRPKRGQILVTEKLPPLVKVPIMDAKYIAVKLNPDVLKNVDEKLKKLGVGLIVEQTEAGTILLGSTRELVGYNKNVTFEGMKSIAKNVLRYLPKLGQFNIIRAFAGLRPSTPDGYPIIGSTKKVEGFIVATGHEGDGIALSPITGRLVSEIITEGKSSIPIDKLSPDRFN